MKGQWRQIGQALAGVFGGICSVDRSRMKVARAQSPNPGVELQCVLQETQANFKDVE